MARKDFYIRETELDDFQTKVIERRTDSSFIVKGCAGSGKSILALWKVKQIQERKLGSFSFIVYTKTLRQYMQDGIKEIGLKNDNVSHYHQWEKKYVDYIIVDEAQDFTEKQILEFMKYANKALILYGDSAQQMYSWRFPAPISIEDTQILTKYPSEQLVFNHRLPKKIARFAEKLNITKDDLEGRCKNEGTEKPKVLYAADKFKQLDKIIQIIKTRRMNDVGILFRRNADVREAADYFKEKGMPCEMKVNIDMDFDFNSTKPKLITYHSSKGTQFQNVFLPDCDTTVEEDIPVLYVATTRTYEGLYIFHSGNLSPFIENIDKNLYDSKLSTQISRSL